MTQEYKDLLLRDLCARLPYNVKCKIAHSYKDKATQDVVTITEISHISPECYFEESDEYEKIENIKPYLRPMSSMTEEEAEEYFSIQTGSIRGDMSAKIDFYIKHHFDFRLTSGGLSMIEVGLALEASEGMYEMKEE